MDDRNPSTSRMAAYRSVRQSDTRPENTTNMTDRHFFFLLSLPGVDSLSRPLTDQHAIGFITAISCPNLKPGQHKSTKINF